MSKLDKSGILMILDKAKKKSEKPMFDEEEMPAEDESEIDHYNGQDLIDALADQDAAGVEAAIEAMCMNYLNNKSE